LEELRKRLLWPSDDEAERAFTTYKNYLLHVNKGLGGVYGVGRSMVPSIVTEVRSSRKYRAIQRRKLTSAQQDLITKALTIAWAKELQLRIPSAFDPQLLPYLIQGSGHLAYYAVFHGARALFVSAGQAFSASHASALAVLSTWVKDRKLFPAPWSVYCEGGPDRNSMSIDGLPRYATLSGDVHPLGNPSPETVWDSPQMFLGTTRDRQIKERKEVWRKETGRKRVPSAEATRICRDLPATTVFSILWRLRKRSDYIDADTFLEGVDSEMGAQLFNDSIARLVHATMVVFESIIVAYIGYDAYGEAADRFLRKATGPGGEAVQERKIAVLGP